MMQPILDYRAEGFLAALEAKLETMEFTEVAALAEEHFNIDTDYSGMEDDENDTLIELDKDDVIALIRGRLFEVMFEVDLMRWGYVDYDWAVAEGLVPA